VQWYIEAVRYSCRRVLRTPLYTGNTSFISRSISVATARWWHKFFSIATNPASSSLPSSTSPQHAEEKGEHRSEGRRSLDPFVGNQRSFSRMKSAKSSVVSEDHVSPCTIFTRHLPCFSASQINARIPPLLTSFPNIRERSDWRPRKRNYREKMSLGVLIKSQWK
jgi:hypothetical protein